MCAVPGARRHPYDYDDAVVPWFLLPVKWLAFAVCLGVVVPLKVAALCVLLPVGWGSAVVLPRRVSGAALRVLHADTERCTVVVFKRRAMRVVHAQLDLGAVRSAAIVARRAATCCAPVAAHAARALPPCRRAACPTPSGSSSRSFVDLLACAVCTLSETTDARPAIDGAPRRAHVVLRATDRALQWSTPTLRTATWCACTSTTRPTS